MKLDTLSSASSEEEIRDSGIIIKILDLFRAKKTYIRKKLGHTMVSAIKAASVTL